MHQRSLSRPSFRPFLAPSLATVPARPRRRAWRARASRGQGLVEYALIIMLVAMVVFAALALIGPSLANFFSGVPSQL